MQRARSAHDPQLDSRLLSSSPAFNAAIELVTRYAECAAPILIVGESGTGKELVARAAHYMGPRRDCPFIPVNCGAIPDALIESELFGHARGAFTDAGRARRGLVREAHGGTLFLDEIEALSSRGQVALLRFLQDASFRSVGEDRSQYADARIVAASNVDLRRSAQLGSFRSDLFFRLDVLTVRLPPLRERLEDLDLLVPSLLRSAALATDGSPKDISHRALNLLRSFDWPGNVRELEHTLLRAHLMSSDACIDVNALLASAPALADAASQKGVAAGSATLREAKRSATCCVERQFVEEALAGANGNISEAARRCHMQRASMSKLVKKYGLSASPARR